MKHFMRLGLAVSLFVGGMVLTMAEANAMVCARGVYRAGCVGARGGVVVHGGGVYHRHVVVGRRRFYR